MNTYEAHLRSWTPLTRWSVAASLCLGMMACAALEDADVTGPPVATSSSAATALARTLYVDARLTSDCLTSDYSVANRACNGTAGSAYNTIQKAVAKATAGDRILIRAGRYAPFSSRLKGTSAAPITFQAYPGERAIVDRNLGGGNGLRAIELFEGSAYIVLDGLEVTDSDPQINQLRTCDVIKNTATCAELFKTKLRGRNGIKINSSSTAPSLFITLKNLQIYHHAGQAILGGGRGHRILNNHIYDNGVISEGYGMYIVGDAMLIAGNRSHDNSGHGIRTGTDGGAKGYLTNSIIERNVLYNNTRPFIHFENSTTPPRLFSAGGDGIVVWHGHGNIIRNNVAYGNGAWGIRVNGDAPFGNKIYNNTLYRNGYQGIYVYDNEQNLVRNNLAYGNLGRSPHTGDLYLGALNTATHNLIGAGPQFRPGSIQSNNLVGAVPGFVDAATARFQLRAGSAAIDRGTPLTEVTNDFAGARRPSGARHDLGAYEFVAAAVASPLPQRQLAVSSATVPLTNASRIFDGDVATRWLMDPAAFPQEFVVALGGSYRVTGLKLYETWAHPTDYEVYVGTPTSWGTRVATGAMSATGAHDVSFAEKTGTHLRVVVKASSNPNYAFLSELNVIVNR
ncbi:MAG: right-handed parallel beta-helix repeat-containing protein [Kofleriaceae bacterium]